MHQTRDNSEYITINKAFKVSINFSRNILIDFQPDQFLK